MANKKLTKKAKVLLRTDVLVSVALTSLLLNVFFFSGIYVFSNTNSIDERVYEVAYKNLCVKNYAENLAERMEDSDDPELAKVKFEVLCKSGDFARYYDSIFDAYRKDKLGS